jgi:hypothetical protein
MKGFLDVLIYYLDYEKLLEPHRVMDMLDEKFRSSNSRERVNVEEVSQNIMDEISVKDIEQMLKAGGKVVLSGRGGPAYTTKEPSSESSDNRNIQ